MRRAVVSIHDVMPETIPAVERLVELASERGCGALTLLVVPGCRWSTSQLDRLHRWADSGLELAGHGWSHRCESVSTWRHRMHSRMLSRNVAEHLALDAEAITALMKRCAAWFRRNGLATPELYVPPAWALGSIGWQKLRCQPFTMVETLSGVMHLRRRRRVPLPLVGFEADTATRSGALRGWNAANVLLATATRLPLRVAIHPHDLELRLADRLEAILEMPFEPVRYSSLLHRANP